MNEPVEHSVHPQPPRSASKARGIASRGRVFHPINGDGLKTSAWYSRVMINGSCAFFPLGFSKPRAETLDRELRAQLRGGHSIAAVKKWVAAQVERDVAASHAQRSAVSQNGSRARGGTIGDVIEVHQRSYFEALPGTTYRYAISLLNLVETALRHRRALRPVSRAGRRVTLADFGNILAQPLSVLDANLVSDFKAARLAGVVRGSPEEKSRKISTNSELRQARCVFSKEALLAYRQAALKIPDLSGFLSAPRFRRVHGRPQLPPEDTIIGVFDGLRTLWDDNDHELFTAVALALYAGLRRNEILHAQRAWMQTTSGPCLVVRLDAEGFRTKNHCERTVPIPGWLFEYLEIRDRRAHLLDGDELARAQTLDRAVAWLRSRGFARVRKPLHTLRALYAAYLLATEQSPFRLKSRLGHADLTTTFRYYADEPMDARLVGLWQRCPISSPARSAAG